MGWVVGWCPIGSVGDLILKFNIRTSDDVCVVWAFSGCPRLVFRGKAGGLPEPLSPFHILLELAVTCEMKALALCAASGTPPAEVSRAMYLDDTSRAAAASVVSSTAFNFDGAPATVDECVLKAREGYKYAAGGEVCSFVPSCGLSNLRMYWLHFSGSRTG